MLDDKESKMIKPLQEYSPEDRAFVEFVQRMQRPAAAVVASAAAN